MIKNRFAFSIILLLLLMAEFGIISSAFYRVNKRLNSLTLFNNCMQYTSAIYDRYDVYKNISKRLAEQNNLKSNELTMDIIIKEYLLVNTACYGLFKKAGT